MDKACVRPFGLLLSAAISTALGTSIAAAAAVIPDNIGGGLRHLIEARQAATSAVASAAAILEPKLLRDEQSRVLVNVWLDGKRPSTEVHQALTALGAKVAAELPSYRRGVISAYVPVDRASDAARMPGVRSVTLEHKPQLHVGKATSQGVASTHADKLNALGFKGQGLTIGAMSDSYNTAPNSETKIHAAQDILSGDLPGVHNPNGDTTPVVLIEDDPVAGTDEGRALLQIIYDIAPKAKLCFATAFTGEVQFAANILKLADPKGLCKANVIDDDVGYSTEPVFSDGVIALAVDQVVADGVAYFSSAGNDNSGNYAASFTRISDAAARSKFAGNLVLGNVDSDLTAGGFHNFGTATDVSIALPIFASAGSHFLSLQWDDPFFDTTPTASYDFLVFDQNGLYHPELSGIDNIYSTGQPVQGVLLDGGDAGATYYLAIALRPGGSAQHAVHLLVTDEDDGNQVTLLKFAQLLAPSVNGHPAAAGAIAVAADFFNNPATTEDYSSLGPTLIYLDQDNLPLTTPERRQKPEIAAPDGVDTTFFGFVGIAGDPHPLFFGTSAAAPHAAAVGALLIQAAGGPGHLPPAQLKKLLENTTQKPHQLTPGAVSASLTSGADTLDIDVRGFIPDDPKQFQFSFSGAAGDSVSSIVLNAAPASVTFRDRKENFFIGKTTDVPPADIVYRNNDGPNASAKLAFLNEGFKAGGSVSVGLDLNYALLGFGGHNAGLLFGTKVTAVVESGGSSKTLTGVLGGPTGRSYTVTDGFGMIDAFAAYQTLTGAQ